MHKLPAQCRWGVVFCVSLRGCEMWKQSFFGTISSNSDLQELAIQKFINCQLTRAPLDTLGKFKYMYSWTKNLWLVQSNELRIIDGKLTIVQVPQVKHCGVIVEIKLIILGQLVGSKGIWPYLWWHAAAVYIFASAQSLCVWHAAAIFSRSCCFGNPA